MQYNGGKKKIAKQLAAIINLAEPKVYWEPFCGMCSVGLLVNAEERHFSDASEATVAALEAARDGYQFPTEVSREQYYKYKELPPSDPLHGFAKFGCSFAGKPWGGYAKNSTGQNYARAASNALKTIGGGLGSAILNVGNYEDIVANADIIYADPPYQGTSRVGDGTNFDSRAFWDWVRQQTATVFVSEYQAPEDFVMVWSKQTTGLRMSQGKQKPTEKLFLHEKHTELISKIQAAFPM